MLFSVHGIARIEGLNQAQFGVGQVQEQKLQIRAIAPLKNICGVAIDAIVAIQKNSLRQHQRRNSVESQGDSRTRIRKWAIASSNRSKRISASDTLR